MSRSAEFFNPNSTPVRLAGPDGKTITIAAKTKVVLSEFYAKYTPRKLRLVRYVDGVVTKRKIVRQTKPAPKPSYKKNVIPNKPVTERINRKMQKHRSMRGGSNRPNRHPRGRGRHRVGRASVWRSKTVGRADNSQSQQQFVDIVSKSKVPISNNIGVGILSFNRFDSLVRLIRSINKCTNLDRTTVFVSDESDKFTTDQVKWLKSHNITLLRNKRIGVAGNTNRLLRCLDRFKYKFILNDDVEIMQPGWENFYIKALQTTGLHHFCFRQPGVYGANEGQETARTVNNVRIKTVTSKPQGGVLVFDQEAFKAVGYFDEGFGLYGMEHVDWSGRVARHFNNPGFHDVSGSEKYLRIHNETSAVPNRVQELGKSRTYFEKVKNGRIHVKPSEKSAVPAISVIVPYRNTGRSGSMRTVINNIRAQKFPRIEIVLVEQDERQTANESLLNPIRYFFVGNKTTNMPFSKAMAFNRGVVESSHNLLVLHDADIIVPGRYLQNVADTLQRYTGCHLGEHVYYLADASTKTINKTSVLSTDYKCVRVVKYFEGGSLGMHRKEYHKTGGFNEEFIGYGVEDCCFYKRLADISNFANNRKVKFFHLFHGRTPGWEECHEKNRQHYGRLLKKVPTSPQYANKLKVDLVRKYPKAKNLAK